MYIYAATVLDNEADVVDAALEPGFGLDRPHCTLTRSPSISRPEAQASAANSAEARSVKLTKAHLFVQTCKISDHHV